MPEPKGFGLYVHWPFCQAKCPYCDFNSHVSQSVDQGAWATAFEREIARVSDLTGPRQLDSVFFGGGTPSLMEPRVVERIIAAAQTHWRFANDIEITLEANPTSVEAAKFEGFRTAGVNRVSVGLQALNDPDLKRLGRLHSAVEGLAAFDIARQVFDRTSFDLIYARQDQTLTSWEDELAFALSLAGEHMSLYQLTIEPNTAFGDRFDKGKLSGLPSDDLSADMFALTQDMTEAAGLPAYEVSNHAAPGAASKHNLIYWTSGDWAGIGPGAHGRLTQGTTRIANKTVSAPSSWLKAVTGGTSPDETEVLSDREVLEEHVMMGLRLTDGIENQFPDHLINKINSLSDNALLQTDKARLSLTPHGRPLLNAVLRELLT